MSNPGGGAKDHRSRGPEFYRRIIEDSVDAVIVVDTDGVITYANPAVENILGYRPDELVGSQYREHVCADQREGFAEALEEVQVTSQHAKTLDVRVRRADGSACWLAATLRNHVDESAVGGILIHSRDETKRKQREAELQTTKERMKMALEGAHLGVWDWDMVTDEIKRDALLTEMLGYTRSEMGDHLSDWRRLVHPDDQRRHNQALVKHLSQSTPYYQCEYRLRTKSGDWKWVRTMGKVVERDGDGRPARAVGIHQDIDEEKRAKIALQEERDMFRMGPAVVFKWEDTDGWPVEYVSENVTEILGYTPEELTAEKTLFVDLVHEDDRERVVKAVAEQRRNGADRLHLEPYRVVTADGDVRWVLEHTKRPNGDGEADYLLGYLVDITERKMREHELQQYKKAVDESAHAIFITDVDGTIEYVNPAFESTTGYSEAEAVGRTPSILQSGTYDDPFYEELWETVLAGEQWESEMIDRRANGKEVVLNETIAPITDDGEIRKFVAVAQDITERKHRERQLRDREQKYRSLFEDTRDALMLLDRDGFFDCNQEALELFGVESVDALLAYTPWELSPPTQPAGSNSKAMAMEHIETAFEEGEALFEWTHERADGTTFPSEVKLSRFEHEGDPALHALVRDITERKAYEATLEEQRDNLDVLNQVLRHDIRNDIQLIVAYAELLADECTSDDAQEYIEIVLDHAGHAVDLTTSARNIAEMMLSVEDDLHAINVRDVLDNEIEELRSGYPDATVTEDAVPSMMVQANDMLGSVFRNLLKNAVQHNDAAVPEVDVTATAEDDAVVVRIADNGRGISETQKERIFGKGEKSLDSQGTGMGLYLVDTLVASYGGSVWVEDNTPKGSVFAVELPKTT